MTLSPASRTGTGATAALARFAAELRFEDLPAAVVEHMRLLILDGLACGLYGSTLPSSAKLRDALIAEGKGPAECTIWGRHERLPLRDAVMANAYAVDSFESDDLHRDALIHAAPVVLAPALALSEKLGARTGRELITALAAGCEVGSRIGMAAGYAMIKRGFHAAAVTGPFLSAATTSRLLRLDAATTRQALGIAGSFGAGLIAAQRGAMVKSLHLAKAAETGVHAGLLARTGFTGTTDVLEAPYGGYVAAFGQGDASPLSTDDLGHRWALLQIGFKKHMCGASTHSGIDAVLSIRDQLAGATPARIDVYVSGVTLEHAGWRYDPAEGPGAARLDLPWCIAAAVVRGRVTVDEFTPEALTDPVLVAMADRVIMHHDPEIDRLGRPARHQTRVKIQAGGRILEAEVVTGLGSQDHPLGRVDVREKLRFLAERSIGEKTASTIEDIVGSIEEADDVSVLTCRLRASA